jgi:V/A-type H+-transporting ATPase subunit E
MAEDIKGLIEKIKQEGIQAAEAKAKEIVASAQIKAEAIIKEAKLQAAQLITAAKEEAIRTEAGTKIALKQASRDMLLTLRKEINAMLERLIKNHVQYTLKADELAKIIQSFVKERMGEGREDIVVTLAKKDAEKLDVFLEELKDSAKRAIIIKPSEDMQGGFVISFDAGKSEFDFSDKALADYITLYLKPKLGEILKE